MTTEAQKRAMAKYFARLKARGLCRRCRHKARNGLTMCASCAGACADRARDLRAGVGARPLGKVTVSYMLPEEDIQALQHDWRLANTAAR